MNAVGIDISKDKSMMAALQPMGHVVLKQKEYPHTGTGLEHLALDILALGEDTRVLMEATGRYHEPVAAALRKYGVWVSVINLLCKLSLASSFDSLLCCSLFLNPYFFPFSLD